MWASRASELAATGQLFRRMSALLPGSD